MHNSSTCVYLHKYYSKNAFCTIIALVDVDIFEIDWAKFGMYAIYFTMSNWNAISRKAFPYVLAITKASNVFFGK